MWIVSNEPACGSLLVAVDPAWSNARFDTCIEQEDHRPSMYKGCLKILGIVAAWVAHRVAFLAPLGMVLAACGDDTPTTCISRNPIRSAADTTGDRVFSGCASPPPAEPGAPPPPEAPPCDASTLAGVERVCELEGTPCTGQVTVSRAAAVCFVEAEFDLTSALQGPFVELIYNVMFQKPIWSVRTVDQGTMTGGGGRSFAVDATTGEILSANNWIATP